MDTTPGLRERKKAAARLRIQEVALDLFEERGFDHVTIEEIAAAAEVSPSSIYRYFGTKERVLVRDAFDAQVIQAFEDELGFHPPVEALSRAVAVTMREVFDEEEALARRLTRYVLEEPALRGALLEETDRFAVLVAGSLARASGRSADELDVQVIASALVWTLSAAIRHWHAHGRSGSLLDEMERALEIAGRGLRLD